MSARFHLVIDEILLEGIAPPATLQEDLLRELQSLLLAPQSLSLSIRGQSHDSLGRQIAVGIARSLLSNGGDSQREVTQHSQASWESGSAHKEYP